MVWPLVVTIVVLLTAEAVFGVSCIAGLILVESEILDNHVTSIETIKL